MLVNVFLLSVVDTHKCVDRFNDTLRISNQIAVYVLRQKTISEPLQETRHVNYLAVRSAHRPQSMMIQ